MKTKIFLIRKALFQQIPSRAGNQDPLAKTEDLFLQKTNSHKIRRNKIYIEPGTLYTSVDMPPFTFSARSLIYYTLKTNSTK